MSEETNIQKMRETIERLSKDKAGLESKNVELTQQLRVRDARDVFRQEGYNPKHGDLYAAVNPEGEITAEAAVAFATEQSLSVLEDTSGSSEESGDSASDDAGDQAGKASMAGGGSRSGDGGAGGASVDTLTREQWKQLNASDPAAAQAAIASGRVEISRDNVYRNEKSGTNPFVKQTTDA